MHKLSIYITSSHICLGTSPKLVIIELELQEIMWVLNITLKKHGPQSDDLESELVGLEMLPQQDPDQWSDSEKWPGRTSSPVPSEDSVLMSMGLDLPLPPQKQPDLLLSNPPSATLSDLGEPIEEEVLWDVGNVPSSRNENASLRSRA